MLPISDRETPRYSVPVITYLLIAVNVIVFLYEVSLPPQQLEQFLTQWAVVPADISAGRNLHTLITSQFLHGGFMHIAGNMLYLWIFGDNVEDALGKIGYLIFYLGAGIVAGLAQVFVSPGSQVPSLGASGAIAGVLGAYIVFYPRARVTTLIFLGIIFFPTRLSALIVIGVWAVLQFFNGFASLTPDTMQTGAGGDGVAYFAHIGGFIAGVVVAFALKPFLRLPTWGPPNYPPNRFPPGGYPRNPGY